MKNVRHIVTLALLATMAAVLPNAVKGQQSQQAPPQGAAGAGGGRGGATGQGGTAQTPGQGAAEAGGGRGRAGGQGGAAQAPGQSAAGAGGGRGGFGGQGGAAQEPPKILEPKVYDYADLYKGLKIQGNNPRAINSFMEGITTRGEMFEMHTSMLGPGLASPAQPHRHAQEELMILLAGTAGFEINGKVTVVGPGSVCFVPSMVWHTIRNVGTEPIRYMHLTILGPVSSEVRGDSLSRALEGAWGTKETR